MKISKLKIDTLFTFADQRFRKTFYFFFIKVVLWYSQRRPIWNSPSDFQKLHDDHEQPKEATFPNLEKEKFIRGKNLFHRIERNITL